MESARPAQSFSCVPCQQRKVKCDRGDPCSNCIKRSIECQQAPTGPRRRRRRFGEGALIARLRHYEALLRRNGIKFESMHPENDPPDGVLSPEDRSGGVASPAPTLKDDSCTASYVSMPKPVTNDSEEDEEDYGSNETDREELLNHNARQTVVKTYWELYKDNDHLLLFGAQSSMANLSTLHPSQGHIFKLWHVYLDNVDPLLKITHTPTLQPRILEAATNLQALSPVMEALLFSIYCIAIESLNDQECVEQFSQHREDLISAYLFGAQQALLRSGILQTTDRECLVAFYLYLMTARSRTDSRSMSSMLGCAIRIAQRLGFDSEASVVHGNTILEAELCRRLWWSLVSFDDRMFELGDYKSSARVSAWTCKKPLNVNDSELRPQIKSQPSTYGRATDALFALVRSEVTAIVHAGTTPHEMYYPNSATPTRAVKMGEKLSEGIQSIEHDYLQYCDAHQPLHYFTIWTTRAFIAKKRAIEQLATSSKGFHRATNEQRDLVINYALYMLQCDTKLMSSSLTTGYFWFLDIYFPGFAYIQACQSLRQRPLQQHAERAWAIMSDNYQHRLVNAHKPMNPLIKAFSTIVVQAWDARMALVKSKESPPGEPSIVFHSKTRLEQASPTASNDQMDFMTSIANMVPYPVANTASSNEYGTPGSGASYYNAINVIQTTSPSVVDNHMIPGLDVEHFDWTLLDWNSMTTG
ncbi:putative C6 transcription factor [Elsinoe ampelina]|uniref:Putative C6 transcription factor n=1 Tax=Elsinoe ampelina TaxID=302913 RepID=A0A6A6G7K1_9PEZI|nr:putative C6 transcription factor [Elsinoe ampelina]